MAKKITPTPAEVANDPSVRWCPYRQWELVWSDGHGGPVRFHHYTGPDRREAVVASLAMGLLPGAVPSLSLRRPSVMEGYRTPAAY